MDQGGSGPEGSRKESSPEADGSEEARGAPPDFSACEGLTGLQNAICRHEVLLPEGSLRPGQHVSLMGADGPGKAEIAVEELARAHVFCDDWGQASHGGELAAGAAAGLIGRERVTELGAVLAGDAPGRVDDSEVTLFDSTGLAIQDLAIALAALERAPDLDLPTLNL